MQALWSLLSRWILWYAITISWFAGALGILTFAPPSPDADTIIYTQLIIADQAGWVLFLLPLAGLTIAAALSYLKSRRVMRTVGLFVGTVTIGIFFLALLGPIIGQNSVFTHVDRVRAGGHVYNLAYTRDTDTSVTLPREYILYECDRFGIRCDVLFRHTEPTNDVSLTVDHGNVVVMANDSEIHTFSPD